jgi:FkbM family methyltransferase
MHTELLAPAKDIAEWLAGRAKRTGIARALRRSAGVQRLYLSARASLVVRERLRLIWREMRGTPRLSDYRLRSGPRVFIRHPRCEVSILDEMFYRRAVDPPPLVMARLLTRPPRVMDLGAHYGLFLAYAHERFGCRSCLAFEPDPANCQVLRRFMRSNEDRLSCKLVEVCASNRDGSVLFQAGGGGHSRIVTRDQRADWGADPIAVPSVDVMPLMKEWDLVKVDIQGGEWAILSDPRLGAEGPGVLFLEYHDHLCPMEDPTDAAEQLLRSAGYVIRLRPRDDRLEGGVWAWREDS